MDILLKYSPTSFRNVIGNKLQLQKVKSCIQDNKQFLILGPPGSGKTLVCEIVCKEHNANALFVCKDSLSQVDHFLTSGTIDSFFDKRKKILVLDNIDTMLQNDRVTVSMLNDIVKTASGKGVMVILTCNSNDEKKVLDIKKVVECIKLGFPSPKETFAYVMNLLDRESIDYDPGEILAICNTYNGNVRETMYQICHGTDKDEQSSFKNMNIFETVQEVFKKKLTLKQARYLSNDDANVLSCMVFENLPEEIYYNRDMKDANDGIILYTKILDKYIDSTLIEDYMCKNHEWSLWDLIYMMRFFGGSTLLHEHPRKDKIKDNMLRMSQLLSKVSHKQIMNKRLKTALHGLSYPNKLWMADVACKQLSEKDRKKKLNADEVNFINTYHKYFP